MDAHQLDATYAAELLQRQNLLQAEARQVLYVFAITIVNAIASLGTDPNGEMGDSREDAYWSSAAWFNSTACWVTTHLRTLGCNHIAG
jgi:hypothetical protein